MAEQIVLVSAMAEMTVSYWLNVELTDLDSDRTHEDLDRQNYPQCLFAPHQNTFQPGKWAGDDACSIAYI